LKVDVHFQVNDSPLSGRRIAGICRKVLRSEKSEGGIAVILADDTAIRDLNRRFLGKDRPTDVLAFTLGKVPGEIWGEVYISVPRARAQAVDYRVPFEEELARLVIHGILHLTGYDDSSVTQQQEMRNREDYFLKQLFSSRAGSVSREG
jgi:rRNA maturation RNase YbeY